MSSFCTAKATHIFFSKKFQHICVSLHVNFNASLTNNVVSFEQLGPDHHTWICVIICGVICEIHFVNIDLIQLNWIRMF